MGLFSRNTKKINPQKLPYSVAFIIDGNGRWAKKRGMPRLLGHKAGIKAVENTIDNAEKMGLKQVSFFCFSTENWNRPKEEVDGLFNLFRKFLTDNTLQYKKRDIKFVFCGNREKISQDILDMIDELQSSTKDCKKMTVCLCINYGGRYDIVQAVNKLLAEGKQNVTEEQFSKALLTADLKDPDLIVRTSGEVRISNFMLYQMAYSEFYFTKTYWPDFDQKELEKAIIEFQGRNRRFGSIKE